MFIDESGKPYGNSPFTVTGVIMEYIYSVNANGKLFDTKMNNSGSILSSSRGIRNSRDETSDRNVSKLASRNPE